MAEAALDEEEKYERRPTGDSYLSPHVNNTINVIYDADESA